MYLPDTLHIIQLDQFVHYQHKQSHRALVVVTVMENVSISVVSGSHFELLISILLLYITLSNKDVKIQAVG